MTVACNLHVSALVASNASGEYTLETFEQMVQTLRPHLDRRGKRGGQAKLSVEDQLLLVLEYWREYRTQFHIATSWGLSESAVCRLIQKVETLLLHPGKFR